MSKPKTFVLAWADAVRDSQVGRNARAVALACLTFADYGSGQNMRAGTATLARCSGLGDRATRYAIDELVTAGLMVWDGRPTAPGITRTYALTVPERWHGDAAVHRERWHGDAATVARGCRNGGTSVQPTKAYQGRPGDDVAPGGADAPPKHVYIDSDGACATCGLPVHNHRHGEVA